MNVPGRPLAPALLLALVGLAAGGCRERSRAALDAPATAEETRAMANDPGPSKVEKTEAEWRKQLTPEQYAVTREKDTEAPFTGAYWNVKDAGTYHCVACGAVLFRSETKFDAGCGWPSFYKPVKGAPIDEHHDTTFGMDRTEVVCSRCGAHLGHVFDDGPQPTGLRYCINSASLDLERDGAAKPQTETKTQPKATDKPEPAK